MSRNIRCLFLFVYTLAFTLPVRAQSATRVELYDLTTGSFPLIVVSMDVFDDQGSFLTNLSRGNVSLFEDDQSLSLDGLEEIEPGVQFVVAVNPGPSFAIQDDKAVSNLQKVMQNLQAWSGGLSVDHHDDLSLITNGGVDAWHMASPQDWLASIQAYQPNAADLSPTLDVLSRAIETASDPVPQPGMKKAVLFITPMPTQEDATTLYNLAELAVDLKVRIYVWIIDPSVSTSTAINPVVDLAAITGGESFFFTGVEPFPDLEGYLSGMRHAYLLSYESMVRTSGSHTLAVQVATGSGALDSLPLTFEMNILPPNPILVSPPEQVMRQNPEGRSYTVSELVPFEQQIDIMVEFPDGITRPLTSTTLYVDGQVVSQNESEPFDQFVWDLRNYESSGPHTLQVMVTDDLGLENSSAVIPVQVTVMQPEHGLLPFLKRNSTWLTGGVVLAAGGLLTWVLVAAGRRHRSSREEDRKSKLLQNDPVTQPVENEAKMANPGTRRVHQPKSSSAYLVRWKGRDKPVTAPPIPLSDAEVIFGSDPTRVTHMLSDPSVSSVHAGIQKTAGGDFILKDKGSIAGTWVNFQQIPERGYVLQHGDLIHFGQSVYRFMLRKIPEGLRPRILLDGTNDESSGKRPVPRDKD